MPPQREATGVMSAAPQRRRSVPLPPVEATERGLAIGAVVWQGLWQAGIARDTSGWPPMAFVLFGLAAASLVGIVLTNWPGWHRRAQVGIVVLDILALVSAGCLLIVTLPEPASGGMTAGALLCALAAGVAGLLLPARQAVVLVGLITLGQLVLLIALFEPNHDVATVVLNPLNAFLIAVVTIAARRSLIRSAEDAEQAAALLLAAQASAASVTATEQRLLVEERLLHETVLNTLTAIVRGGIGTSDESRALLRTRSEQSAHVLEDFDSVRTALHGSDPDLDLSEALALVRASGADVTLDVAALARLDGVVYDAFIGAVREALANTARHAGATAVSVTATVTDSARPDARVVVRDDGVGFDPRSVRSRFGIDRAITASMSLVSGTAQIESAPGAGTAVTLRWRAPAVPRSAWLGIDRDAFTVPVIAAYGMFGALSIALTWPGVTDPKASMVAAALAVVAGVTLVAATRRGPLTTSVVLVVLGLAPLIYTLQRLSTVDSTAPWVEWSSTIISGLFLVVAARGPWWAWIAALGMWLSIQGDPLHELLQPGSAIIIAGGVLAHLLRSSASQLDASIAARAEQESATSSAEQSITRLRRRYAALSESDAGPLLVAIAEDMLDPSDDAVRASCSAEEGFIRAVMRLEPDADWLQGLAFELAKLARSRGVRLDVDISAVPAPGAPVPQALMEVCMDAVAAADPSEPCRLTARREDTDLAIRLVLATVHGWDGPDVEGDAYAYGILVHRDPSAVMIEARIGTTNEAAMDMSRQGSNG